MTVWIMTLVSRGMMQSMADATTKEAIEEEMVMLQKNYDKALAAKGKSVSSEPEKANAV